MLNGLFHIPLLTTMSSIIKDDKKKTRKNNGFTVSIYPLLPGTFSHQILRGSLR